MSVPEASGPPPVVGLARAELMMGLRAPALRVLAVLAMVLGWSAGSVRGGGVAMSAYNTGEAAWQYLGMLAIIWMAVAASRESAMRTAAIVYSKPQPTERLVLARFVGLYAQMLVAAAAMFVGAALSQLVQGVGVLGWAAYGAQFLRVAGVLFFACSASYTLSLLAESPVAGALVGLYWVALISGRNFLAKAYYPAYTQNLPAYVLLGVFLICIAMAFHRRSHRGGTPVAFAVHVAAPLALALFVFLVARGIITGHDPQAREHPVLERMETQSIIEGYRAPGMLLPDQHGRLVRLSDYAGKVLVVAVWTPQDLESAELLETLQKVTTRYGSRGVQAVAICVSEDEGAARTFALGSRATYPIVADWGSHHAPRAVEASPMASAYQASPTPVVAITDRRRRVQAKLDGPSAYTYERLSEAIDARIRAEPN